MHLKPGEPPLSLVRSLAPSLTTIDVCGTTAVTKRNKVPKCAIITLFYFMCRPFQMMWRMYVVCNIKYGKDFALTRYVGGGGGAAAEAWYCYSRRVPFYWGVQITWW